MTTRRNDGEPREPERTSEEQERRSSTPEERRDDRQGRSSPGGGDTGQSRQRQGRGSNLSEEDRARGGERSAGIQQRDEFGQFAGVRGGASSSGQRDNAPQGQPGRSEGNE